MSPLVAETAESNRLVLATAARLTVEPGATPVGGNGPVASGKPKNCPGAISGATIAAAASLPTEKPATSGSPNAHWTSSVIGTVPWAATASTFVFVGTSQFGCAASDSGNGTLFTSVPSSSCGTRPFRRASAKKSFWMLPVLATVMVAVTGTPAGSTVLGEFGIPLLVTVGAVNETAP